MANLILIVALLQIGSLWIFRLILILDRMHRMIVNSFLDILETFSSLLILLELFSRGESFLLVLEIFKIIIINEQASIIMINVI